MTQSIVLHITMDLAGRFRQVGLQVAEHANAVTVWCPSCTERQEYRRTAAGWAGKAFLHDDGCPQFRERLS